MDCNVAIAKMEEKIDNMSCILTKIDKTLHGNGRLGLVDEFNQFKGGLKVIKWGFSGGIALALITSFISIFI